METKRKLILREWASQYAEFNLWLKITSENNVQVQALLSDIEKQKEENSVSHEKGNELQVRESLLKFVLVSVGCFQSSM